MVEGPQSREEPRSWRWAVLGPCHLPPLGQHMLWRFWRALGTDDSLAFPFQQERSEAPCQPVVTGTYLCHLPPFWDLEDKPDMLTPLKTSQPLSPTGGSHCAPLVRPQVPSPTSAAIPLP